ncbi:MAG: methyltransferase family protein [Candidatus Hermodarchaeota archaeon]
MTDKNYSQGKKKSSRFIIVIFPNVLFFIILGIMIYLWFLFELPWLFFPRYDVSFPLRLAELILGYLLTIGGLYFFTWGLTSITRARASGQEIGKSLEYSTLIKSGAFSICRHPITLGFIFILPGVSLIFDLIPLVLMTFIYNPMLIAILFYEEKELIQRFGENYIDYKKKVPFLIPCFKKDK